jgi:serine/threonine-protein kinase
MERSLIGKTVGNYHLIDRLGAGGMASVYRAYAVHQDRYVAVKILPIHLAAHDLLYQRFMREAQMAARLQHPHILPIYDFGEHEGIPYIVLKLVEGGTLDSFICEGPLSLHLIARVIEEVAGALDYAHSQGVIHRDLKPENILFDVNGAIYLADFGIARLAEAGESLTGSGGFVGTAAYASPEQCRGEDLAPTSDLYSLGVVLYEMLTGQTPFDGPTGLAIMHRHISETVPNPLKHRPELPIEINEVLRKAMAKLPAVRYQTASALSAALHEALRRELGNKHPGQAAPPPPGPNPVFDKPATAYPAPLPLPDDLLPDLAPGPTARSRAITQTMNRPAEISAEAVARPTPRPAARDHGNFLIILAALIVLIAVVLLAYTLLAHWL